MLVRGTELGFYGGSLKHPGQEFEIPDGSRLGRWMEPVDQQDDKPVARTRKSKRDQETE